MGVDLEALSAEYHQPLFRYLCRAVGDADTARDLTQEVFLRVSRTTAPDAVSGGVRAWLFRIARNLAIDHHRRRQRAAAMGSLAPGTTGQAASQDVVTAVNEALASLPNLERDVFLLREVGGLGYEEIAQVCELTPDAVRSRIHRTRLRLRELLAAPIGAHRVSPMTHSGRIPD